MAHLFSSTLRRGGRWLRSREGIALLVVLLVAAVLRGAYLVHFSAAPDFEYPAIDAGFHDYWARSIAFPEAERPTHVADPELESSPYLRPPGYPYFLAGIYTVFGDGYLAPRIVQLLLGLASVALCYVAGRKTFGHVPAVAAAAFMATASTVIYFEGELHAETLLMPLLLGFFLAMLALRRAPSIKGAVLCGVLLGLAALVRSNVLIFAALVPLWLWWRTRGELPGRRLLGVVGTLLLSAAVAISPTTLRNAVVAGDFVPISSNLGINLLIGNNPRATPVVAQEVPGLGKFETCYDYPALVDALERKLGRKLSHSEVSRYFTGEALDWISGHPAEFSRLTARKAYHFWRPTEISHNKVVALEIVNAPLLRFLPSGFSVLLLFGGIGLLVWWLRCRAAGRTERGRRAPPECAAEMGLLLLIVAGWFLSVLPFFLASRYRLPLVPFLALPAGYGAVLWFESSVLRFGRVIGAAYIALLLLVSGTMSFAALDSGSPNALKWHMDRGRAYNRGEEVDRAIEEFGRALEVNPRAAEAHYSLGHSRMQKGDVAAAVPHFEKAVEYQPDHASALNNLGTIAAQRSRFDVAIGWYERLVAVQPLEASGLRNLALAQTGAGALADAAVTYRRALEVGPRDVATKRAFAGVLIALRRYGEALGQLKEVLQLDPAKPAPAKELAWLLATCPDSRLRDGAQALRLAEGVDRAFQGRRWNVLEVVAAAQAEVGRFDQAVTTAERALALARAAGQEALATRLPQALAGYRAGRPYRLPE